MANSATKILSATMLLVKVELRLNSVRKIFYILNSVTGYVNQRSQATQINYFHLISLSPHRFKQREYMSQTIRTAAANYHAKQISRGLLKLIHI